MVMAWLGSDRDQVSSRGGGDESDLRGIQGRPSCPNVGRPMEAQMTTRIVCCFLGSFADCRLSVDGRTRKCKPVNCHGLRCASFLNGWILGGLFVKLRGTWICAELSPLIDEPRVGHLRPLCQRPRLGVTRVPTIVRGRSCGRASVVLQVFSYAVLDCRRSCW